MLLLAPFKETYIRRDLIREFVSRDLRDRYTGQFLGIVWAYGHPLLLMMVYTFLFAYVFPTRFGAGASMQDFSVNVLAGVLPWLAFQDALSRSTTTLMAQSNLVKQIVFPIEVLPLKTAFSSALPYCFGLLFVVGYAAWHGTLTWFSLSLIFVVLFQLIAMVGVSFMLAAISVFFRDIKDFVQFFCAVNLFAQPILYNPSAVPDFLLTIFKCNPFSYLTWCWQDALYNGGFVHSAAWIVLPIISLLSLIAGWSLFQKLKNYFGDAL